MSIRSLFEIVNTFEVILLLVSPQTHVTTGSNKYRLAEFSIHDGQKGTFSIAAVRVENKSKLRKLVLCRQTGPPDQFSSQVLSPQFDDFPLKTAAPPSNDSGLSTPGAQDGISFVEAPVSPGNATEVRTVNYPVWSPYFLGSSMYVVVIRVLRKSDQVARLFCVPPYNPSTVCTSMYVGQA